MHERNGCKYNIPLGYSFNTKYSDANNCTLVRFSTKADFGLHKHCYSHSLICECELKKPRDWPRHQWQVYTSNEKHTALGPPPPSGEICSEDGRSCTNVSTEYNVEIYYAILFLTRQINCNDDYPCFMIIFSLSRNHKHATK
jgi:hypothetical protein